jgi:two-component system sensor kinase FixL
VPKFASFTPESDPFNTLLDAAVDAIAVIDESGCLQRVNTALCRMFGYTPEDLLGNNVRLLMPASDATRHDSYIARYLETGERQIIGIGRETVGLRKDGSQFPLYLSVGHITESGMEGFVGIMRDLTAQRDRDKAMVQNELEIRQLRERLGHVARVSTLGEMVTGIAHEVNQPLTVIATYAQACTRLIEDGRGDPEQLTAALRSIASQAERAATVISRIRNFAKRTEIVDVDCDCPEALEDVIALADVYALEEQTEIRLQYDPEDNLTVRADPIQLQQITLNLINNAIESMRDVSGPKEVKVSIARTDKGMIEVAVSDTGTGIEPDVVDQLFDTFFTTKDEGMGIGLAICKSLLDAHGGSISATNNSEGPGATFRFRLPAAVEPSP